jgi:hypothetical protein
MIKKVSVRIRYDRRSSVAALLAVAVLVAAFLAYLLWGQTRVAAGMGISRSAPSSKTTQAASTGGARQYYLTPSVAFDGAQAAGACATGYHMASAWELLDTSNLQYDTTLGRTRDDSGYGPPSYFEGWVRTGYNGSTANTVGQANCNAWTSASSGGYGTSLYLPRDWLTGQDLGTWKTGAWQCSNNLPVWCIADQATLRQYYLTEADTYTGSQPKTACAAGYHMASLWEILDPSNLRYNINLGYERADIGTGPPTATFGWIRTGYDSNDGSTSAAGQANCSVWSIDSSGKYGTTVRLPSNWKDSNQQDIAVWDAGLRECSETAPAWCVADAVDGLGSCSIPRSITCGQQVSGDTTGLANHINTYGCSAWPAPESGPEVIYRLDLPTAFAPYDVTATLSDLSEDLDVFILPAGGCYSGECLTSASYGNFETTVTNVSGGTYYIAVDGYDGDAGSYTLSVDCELRQVYLPLALRNFQ